MNVVMTIDPAWSYNLIGGIESTMDTTMVVKDEVYGMASDWVKQFNNHMVTRNSPVWNAFADNLNLLIVSKYALHPSYFVSYFNMLYNMLRPGLNSIQREIVGVKPFCNKEGDVIALVVEYI